MSNRKKAGKAGKQQQVKPESVPQKVAEQNPKPNLDCVEHYDTGYGIALDDAGEVYKFQSLRHDPCGRPAAFDYLKKLTLSEALEWLADMEEVEGVGSSHDHPRFFRLLASKLRDVESKPERPVSELDEVESFEFSDGSKAALLVDDKGQYYTSDGGEIAKRVTLKQAVLFVSDKNRDSMNGGGFSAYEEVSDFLDKVAEKLPEGV